MNWSTWKDEVLHSLVYDLEADLISAGWAVQSAEGDLNDQYQEGITAQRAAEVLYDNEQHWG